MLSEKWRNLLGAEGQTLLTCALRNAEREYAVNTVYPPRDRLFAAFSAVFSNFARASLVIGY